MKRRKTIKLEIRKNNFLLYFNLLSVYQTELRLISIKGDIVALHEISVGHFVGYLSPLTIARQ